MWIPNKNSLFQIPLEYLNFLILLSTVLFHSSMVGVLHIISFCNTRLTCILFCKFVEMQAKLSRREKAANITPYLDIDIFMKVRKKLLWMTYSLPQYMIDSLAQIVFLSKPTLKVRFNIQTHLFWSREVTFVAVDKLCGFILASTILREH